MKWIDDKVIDDEKFNEDKNNIKERIVQWIKRHEFNQKDGYEPQMTIKKFFDAYSEGRIRIGYGDALDIFLTSNEEYAKFTYDPEYHKIIESLKRLHDSRNAKAENAAKPTTNVSSGNTLLGAEEQINPETGAYLFPTFFVTP